MKISFLLLSCGLFCCATLVGAAPAKKSPPKAVKPVNKPKPLATPVSKPVPTPAPSKYDQKPLNMAMKSVPVGYEGHDVVQLYNALTARVKPQGKSEGILEYLDRMDAQMKDTKPLWGNVKFDSPLANVQELRTEYDAETGKMRLNFYILPTPKSLMTGMFKNQGLLKFSSTVVDQTLYKNAKGEDVVKGIFNQYNLLLTGWQSFPVPIGVVGPYGQLEVAMTPEQAKLGDKNLKALLVYNLSSGYHDKETERIPPNEDFLLDTVTTHQVVHGELKEIWIYHAKTGELWIKFWPKAPRKEEAE